MNDHDDHMDLQTELPAYAAGRLEDTTRERVEAHLALCDECQDLARAFKGLEAAIREGGASLFGPHPPEADLWRYAWERAGVPDPGLRNHLDTCVSCSLEVEGWKRMARRPPVSARTFWGMPAFAAAAGLVAGLGLAFLLMRAPLQLPPAPPPAGDAAIGPQLTLPPVLRGGPGRVTYAMNPDQQTVVVAWPAAIPHDARPDERCRFDIGPPGAAASWSQELPAAEIRRHLEAAEVVTFLLPAAALSSGPHEARMFGAGTQPLYEAVVDVRASGSGVQ